VKRLSVALLLCLAGALTIGAAPAFSQQKEAVRHGLWFNVGLGWGSLGCKDCSSRTGGLSGGLSLGGTISPSFLIGVGMTGWTKSEGGATLSVGTLDLRVRIYPSAKNGFFITGGIGAGRISAAVSGFGSAGETGAGAVIGLGYDARIGKSISLTPFFNGVAVKTSNGDANFGQVGIGITL
jgi:hypothetical protein